MLTRTLTLILAVGLVVGCENNSSLPALPEPGDQPIDTRTGSPRYRQIDAVLTDIARHVDAVPSNAPPSVARATVVQWGRFTNMTGVRAERFAQFRADTQRLIAQLAPRHNMVITRDPARGGLTAFELQATVLLVDEDDGNWLVRWALYGPQRDGGRGLVWQDETLLAAG